MKWHDKYTVAFITAFLGIGCISWFMLVVFRNDPYKIIGGAFIMFFEMIILVLTALILRISQKTKPIGQGVLLGSAITLVIGFGVCSFA